jgi:chloride channel 7
MLPDSPRALQRLSTLSLADHTPGRLRERSLPDDELATVQRQIAQLESERADSERRLSLASKSIRELERTKSGIRLRSVSATATVDTETTKIDDNVRRQSVLLKEQTELRYSKAIRHRRASVIKSEKVRRTIPAWAACIAIGLLVGVADAVIIQSLNGLFGLKALVLQWTADHHSSSIAFVVLLAFCLPMTLLATCMVVYVAPKAAGSGLAEVKALLNGSAVPGLLTFTTAFVKMVGITLTIIGGLALGREGPMVHVGAAMANFILHVPYFKKRIIGVHTTRRAQAIFNVRSNHVNHYVIMGGAAGIAAAFNAPMTGVLYMLEEMASHWPTWLTVQVFVCVTFAALTMQCVANGIQGIGEGTSAFLVNDHSDIARMWVASDMPVFIIIGIAGGLLSSCLIICCKQVFLLRRRFTAKLGNKWSFFEVAVLTLIAVLVLIYLPLAFSCDDDASLAVGSHEYDSDASEHHRLLEGGGDGESPFVKYRCDAHHHNQMASLAHWNPEHTIVMLWSEGLHFDIVAMLVYLPIYMLQFVLLPGIPQ